MIKSGHYAEKSLADTMQALALNKTLSYRQDLPKPVPAANEALIRLSLAGICATDLQLTKGYADFSGIPGHEFVGVVEAVNNAEHQPWLQQRVVGSINIGCGRCPACLSLGPEHCRQRKVLGIRDHDGVFADYFTLPVNNLYALPDEISDECAVFTEPLAAACRVAQQLNDLGLKQVAVLGPGRLGLLIAQTLALQDFQVLVLGRSPASLQLPEQWGLNCRLVSDIADQQFPCVVDASGSAAGFQQALRILQARGYLLLKSTFPALEPVDLSKIVVHELQVLGSRCGPFSQALALLKQQQIPLSDLIDGRYALQDGLDAFRQAGQTGVRKILLHP